MTGPETGPEGLPRKIPITDNTTTTSGNGGLTSEAVGDLHFFTSSSWDHIIMIRTLVHRGLAGLLLLSLLVSPQSAEAAGIPAARRLPPEVVVYLTAPDVADFKKRFGQSSFGRMIKDPALADFVGDVKKGLTAISTNFQATAGISMDQFLAIPGGEVSLALFVGATRAPGWVVLLDFGKNRATVETLLTKFSDGLTQNGAKKTQVESAGVSISNFDLPKPPAGDPDVGAGPSVPTSLTRIGWFTKDTTLVLGNGTQTLRTILARWDGKHTSTFASNPVYRYIAKNGSGDGAKPVMEWYFNPIGAVQGLMNAVDPNNFQAQLALGFLPTLGLDKIKAIGGTMNIMTPKFEQISRTMVYVEAPRDGALDLLKFPAIAQSPPKWVPANTVSYNSVNWDLKAAWRGVSKLVDSFNPQGPGTFDRLVDDLAQQPGGPMIHPKKDLFDHLSGRIQVVSGEGKATDGGALSTQFLLALGVKNTDGLKATLNKLINTPGSPVETRQFRGETIYEIPFPAALSTTTGLTSLGLSITQGNLMIASPATMIEQAIRADNDPLSASSDYKRLASAFPAKASMISYAKQSSQLKTVYDLLRSGNFPPAAPGAGFPGADANPVPIDFTKLPPFEVIEKYLRPSGGYVVPDENGAVMVGFSLRDKTP